MAHPTISVVIPCYNSGPYIIEAVESVRIQQGNFILNEVIVIDDHSDDSPTLNALKALKDSQLVRLAPNKFARGPGGARNTGIEMVQSEFIAFLDADDILLPESIAVRTDALSRYPQIKWCGGDFVNLYPDGSCSEPVYRSGKKHSPAFDGYDFSCPLLIENPVIYFFSRMLTWLGAVLIRTDVLRKIGGFNENLRYSEDSDLFIRIALENDFLFIPDVTFMHRQHPNSHSKSETSPREWPIKSFKSLLNDQRCRPYTRHIRRSISRFYKENYRFHIGQHRHLRALMDRIGYLIFKHL